MAKETVQKCPQCNGTGQRKYPGRRRAEACRYCGGTGKVVVYQPNK